MVNQVHTVQQLQQKATLARQAGDRQSVEKLYKEILQIQPDCLTVLSSLGKLLINQKRWEEAVALYQNALSNELPLESKTSLLGLLGKIYLERYQFNEAIRVLEEATNLEPRFFEAQVNLGISLMKQSRFAEAEQAYRQALTLDRNSAIVYNKLGMVLKCQNKLEEAREAYRQAVELKPDWIEPYINLGNALKSLGEREEASKAYEQALKIEPNNINLKLSLAICQLAIIYRNPQEILQSRQNYQQRLQELIEEFQSLPSGNWATCAGGVGLSQPYYLPYQGLNDRQLQQDYGQLICRIMAHHYPQWSQPLAIPDIPADEKLRVGIVSGFFREHSVWKIPLKGWVENLDAGKFELFGYHTNSRQDRETLSARKSFKKFIQGPLSIERWCQAIAEDKLHFLIFSEFGMDPTTLQLGCLRLAPIQLTTWGHPETSGLPTIDYFLSSDLMEPEGAERCYTEKLVRLPNLSIYYSPLDYYPESVSRKEIDIKSDDVMFWCCQSLYKYLPQDDDIFPRIASRLEKARFVFIEHNAAPIANLFKARLHDAFSLFDLNYQEFCRFVPPMNPRRFAGLASIADVFLDSIGWSGCNSALESLVFDLPVVTLPGEFMRGRHSFAMLEMIGIEETIASSKEDYIDLAVRLGKEGQYRQAISIKIAQNKSCLYQDLRPVKALEDWLLQLAGKQTEMANSGETTEIDRADKLQALGKFAAAREVYQQVLSREPDNPKALLGLATIAQKKGQLSVAEKRLVRAVEVQPDLLPAWFSLGNLLQAQGRLDEAIAAYHQALELRYDLVAVHNNIAYVLQESGRLDEAINHYRTALSLQPNSREIDVHLANALYLKGELPDEQWKHYAKLNYDLGVARQQVRDLKAAIVYFQQATALNSHLAEAHLRLGIALRNERGQGDEALSCFEKVKELKPQWQRVSLEATLYKEIGRTYQIQKDIDRAVKAFQKVVSLVNPHYLGGSCHALVESESPNLEKFLPPAIVFEEVEVGAHRFPAIPPVVAGDRRPFWSVAIPALNRPEYFPECLASVLAQWSGNEEMEIIVLDNGSEPPLWDIVNRLGGGIIQYYRFPKTVPLQQNWNTLVSLCRGQWIHLLHHDDYVLPNFYDRLKNSLATCTKSVGAAFTGYENINENHQVVFTQEHGLKHFRGVVKGWVQRIGVSCPLSPPSVVIRREAYERLGGYKLDILYTCDWEFYKRVASFYEWWYEPGILAHYREHSNSLTVNLNINNREEESSGAAHRRAIEISESYLPVDWRDEITAKSRRFHHQWCLDRATIPLGAGSIDGAFRLVQEALRIDSSPEGIDRVFNWLTRDKAASLRNYIASRLMKDF